MSVCGRCGNPFWSTDPEPPALCRCVADLEAALAACRADLRASESRHASDSEVYTEHVARLTRERDAARADAAAARGALDKAVSFIEAKADETWDQSWQISLRWMADYVRALDAAGRAAGEEHRG